MKSADVQWDFQNISNPMIQWRVTTLLSSSRPPSYRQTAKLLIAILSAQYAELHRVRMSVGGYQIDAYQMSGSQLLGPLIQTSVITVLFYISMTDYVPKALAKFNHRP